MISLVGCANEPSTQTVVQQQNVKPSNLKVLEEDVRISSGKLSIYTYGDDTLFVMEGYSQSYPVSIQIK